MKARSGSEGYRGSQKYRKKIEEVFGWLKEVAWAGPIGGEVEVAADDGTGGGSLQCGSTQEVGPGWVKAGKDRESESESPCEPLDS